MKLTLNKQTILFILSSIVMCLILLNNLVYQTGFQFNQVFFNILVLFALILFIMVLKKINYGVLYFSIIIAFIIYGVILADDSESFNRIINFSLVILSFFLIFYISQYLKVNNTIFYLYFIVYIFLCFTIVIIGDRGIINPNWVAMTFFYLIGLFLYDKSKVFLSIVLLFGFITSFFIFESRGTSITYLVAMITLLFLNISHKFVRVMIIVILSLISVGYFYFLDFLTNYKEIAELVIAQYTERGLGGREGVFIIGYEYLYDSGFLGYGIQMPGGFEDPKIGQSVHIHFGLLDLALKFSIFIVVIYILFIFFYIRKIDKKFLPFIAGGLMTVFYYNGLAPSHLGLNLLLYLLLGFAYYTTKKLRSFIIE